MTKSEEIIGFETAANSTNKRSYVEDLEKMSQEQKKIIWLRSSCSETEKNSELTNQ